MSQEKKIVADKSSTAPNRVMVYPDGSIRVDPNVILRQYREQFRDSARSNLEEERWQKLLDQ